MSKDDFWSIDKLIPRIHSSSAFSQKPSPFGVPISSLDGRDESRNFGEKIEPIKSRCILSYRLSNEILPLNDLILENSNTEDKVIPFVPCISYSPSFISLNEKQKEYFRYFISKTDQKIKIKIDFPYLQLYLCRMIRNPKWNYKEYDLITWVWKSYRKEFPLCDKLFCDTISDYCFYRKTTPPYDLLSEILTEDNLTSRPFLLCPFLFDYLFDINHKLSNNEINFILRTVTLQSYRKSKAYRCNKTFAAATESAVKKAFDQGLFNRVDLNAFLFNIQIPSQVKSKRRLFQGLPASEVPDIEIDLDHIPFLHDENIRSRCDELIRYLENRIRKILKIKNSLSRIHISQGHRDFLDGILSEYEVLAPKEEIGENKSAEDKFQIEKHELEIDFEFASKIEEDSWSITKSLTESYTKQGEESILLGGEKIDEDFDKVYSEELKKIDSAVPVDENEFWEFAATLTEAEDEFVRTILHRGVDSARFFSQGKGLFFDALLLECNRKSQNVIGDSLLDTTGQIYPDYVDILKEVFPPLKGD